MNTLDSKSAYFDISKSLSIPARCPLLGRCERRAHTIALANEWPLDDAVQRVGLHHPIVKSIGESAYLISGNNNFLFGGQCPEVNLFESTSALIGFSGEPTIKGDYDVYFPDEKYRVLDTGHYSQCAEYSSQPPSNAVPSEKQLWFAQHYQWLIGTAITLVGTVAAILALK